MRYFIHRNGILQMRYDFLMSYNLLKTLHKITPWSSFVFLVLFAECASTL